MHEGVLFGESDAFTLCRLPPPLSHRRRPTEEGRGRQGHIQLTEGDERDRRRKGYPPPSEVNGTEVRREGFGKEREK